MSFRRRTDWQRFAVSEQKDNYRLALQQRSKLTSSLPYQNNTQYDENRDPNQQYRQHQSQQQYGVHGKHHQDVVGLPSPSSYSIHDGGAVYSQRKQEHGYPSHLTQSQYPSQPRERGRDYQLNGGVVHIDGGVGGINSLSGPSENPLSLDVPSQSQWNFPGTQTDRIETYAPAVKQAQPQVQAAVLATGDGYTIAQCKYDVTSIKTDVSVLNIKLSQIRSDMDVVTVNYHDAYENRIHAVESKLDSITTDCGALSHQVGHLEKSVAQNAELTVTQGATLDGLSRKVKVATTDLESMTDGLNEVKKTNNKMKRDYNELYSMMESLQAKQQRQDGANRDMADKLDDLLNNHIPKLFRIERVLATLRDRIDVEFEETMKRTVKESTEPLWQQVATLDRSLSQLSGTLEAHNEERHSGMQKAIDVLTTTTATTNHRVDTLQTVATSSIEQLKASLKASEESAQTIVVANTATTAELREEISGIQQSIELQRANVVGLPLRITALEERLEHLATGLDARIAAQVESRPSYPPTVFGTSDGQPQCTANTTTTTTHLVVCKTESPLHRGQQRSPDITWDGDVVDLFEEDDDHLDASREAQKNNVPDPNEENTVKETAVLNKKKSKGKPARGKQARTRVRAKQKAAAQESSASVASPLLSTTTSSPTVPKLSPVDTTLATRLSVAKRSVFGGASAAHPMARPFTHRATPLGTLDVNSTQNTPNTNELNAPQTKIQTDSVVSSSHQVKMEDIFEFFDFKHSS